MLTKFAVKNYRGFKDRIELDLSNPGNYEFNSFAIKNGIVKNGIIYGPNGSGKTNLGLAIFDIVNHLTQKWKLADYYSNFKYIGNHDDFVDFEYTFNFNGVEILYCYSKTSGGVLKKESLFVANKEVFNRANGVLTIDEDVFPIGNDKKQQLGENANNVSIVGFLLMSTPLNENHYLIKLQQFVDSMLWFRCLKNNMFIGLESSSVNIEEFIISHDLIKDFESFLKNVSDQEYDLVSVEEDQKNLWCKIDDVSVRFDTICSTGTEALLLLYYWTKQIGKASFVFIDEFDAFYHFKLSKLVCKLLFAMDCQVFLSSHNTYLMSNSILRPDCNFIISNNLVKSLNKCTNKDLRFGHNMEKLYRGDIFSV